MKQRAVLVLDCGATNIRSSVVSEAGTLLASASRPNNTQADPFFPGGMIWDPKEIWAKFGECCAEALKNLAEGELSAVTVTTFGVDGTLFDRAGRPLYPVISWQCLRTVEVMANIGRYLKADRLYRITGLQAYHFNTISKLAWFRENRPDLLDEAAYFLFIPSIFLFFLTGEFVTDTTMAGTSMLTSLKRRDFSPEILTALGVRRELFPHLVEPGTVVGRVTADAAAALGIPAGIPVTASGHDTQFAVFGAGGEEKEPVLSSGTWEVLMARTHDVRLTKLKPGQGVTVEFDAVPGYFNPGVMWVASGVLEWLAGLLYADLEGQENRYHRIIEEAEAVAPGCDGVKVLPEMFSAGKHVGVITGLAHTTSRGQLYRAALEALACYAAKGLELLQLAGGFKAEAVICAGGGSKNPLWNQLKADVLGVPVKASNRSETTVLGAAMFALAGTGLYSSPAEGLTRAARPEQLIHPSEHRDYYQDFYYEYLDFYNRTKGG